MRSCCTLISLLRSFAKAAGQFAEMEKKELAVCGWFACSSVRSICPPTKFPTFLGDLCMRQFELNHGLTPKKA